MRGQISFEYLLIVGIAILVIVPAIIFFLTYTKTGGDTVSHARISEIGLTMTDTVADTYALGRNSWLTVDVNMPENVVALNISADNELVIRYRTQYGIMHAVFFPRVPITNEADVISPDPDVLSPLAGGHPGLMSFKFTSLGDTVRVEEVAT